MNQLYEIYGHNLTKTMLDQFNTKFVFRTEEQDFINYICKSLGDIEYIESSENLSYGAHEMRDGVNFSKQEKRRPLLTHNDIANLKDLEYFVKLPQLNKGVVKLETKFVQFR